MRYSIQEVARLAGVSSRTLRHYDAVGLLPPTAVGANGYRRYDAAALTRLQRILVLRELGLGLPAIAEALDGGRADVEALEEHLHELRRERERLERMIRSVESTIHRRRRGEELVPEQMFDGFDHTQYREEVEQRWGADAYAQADRWWRGMPAHEKAAFQAEHAAIAADYVHAHDAGVAADSDEVLAVAARHHAWLSRSAAFTGGPIDRERMTGYGDMYVADPRYWRHYGGADGTEYVRAAMRAYADRLP